MEERSLTDIVNEMQRGYFPEEEMEDEEDDQEPYQFNLRRSKRKQEEKLSSELRRQPSTKGGPGAESILKNIWKISG
jgi:hypothetical protein